MTPSWYDLLGVEPDADDARIRAAWRTAIADLDPSDRRFRVLNGAAEVLLDPERRAAYDEELGARLAAEDAAAAEAERDAEPDVQHDAGPDDGPGDGQDAEDDDTLLITTPPVAQAGERGRRGVPGWLLVGLMVLTAAMIAASAWVWVKVPSDASVAEATTAAQAAAERAIVPVLSYDYRDMDASQATAHRYLTSSYRKEYDQLFAVLAQNAPGTETVVMTEVIASGIVRSGADRVQILLFVNRPTTNADQKTPVDYKDQVTVTMVDDGGQWLVDGLDTTPPAA